MHSPVKEALQELELSTDALLSANAADTAALGGALDRRAAALTRLMTLAREPGQSGDDSVDRLRAVLESGKEAARKLREWKQEAIEEWGRLNGLAQGLGPSTRVERPHGVDYSA